VIIGGLAQMYVIIIGGQAYPMEIFPGKEVVSSFADGIVGSYTPSLPEVVLGVGGVALALAATFVGVRVLRFMPVSLADESVDPHYPPKEAEASA
jgi:molybdopterin-containing oxidoreductase family membrane subunit